MAADRVDKPRLCELLAGLTEGLLTQVEEEELTGLLNADDAARAFYRDYIAMDAQLWWEYALPKVSPHAEVPVPAPGFFTATFHSTVGYFSSGWPVAYLVATVVLSIGLFIAHVTPNSHPVWVAQGPRPTQSRLLPEPELQSVGRITGVADCRWAGETIEPVPGTPVPLGRRYSLASGLLEITYDRGARVILQGPVAYKVESAAGGFLSVGKLTAKVEQGSEVSNHKSEITNPKFIVRTPTATVTDLGTEFGVEVAKSGETTSHVFRGSIRIQGTGLDGKVEAEGRILGENETVHVEGSPGSRQIVTLHTFTPSHFVRQIPQQVIKTFDLADVVAGGDGFSGRRNRGIDPTSGGIVHELRPPGSRPISGDGQYHRMTGRPLVDGVFVPNGDKGAVQVDSAGHTFDGFLNTANLASQYIWAGGQVDKGVSTTLADVDYASSGHGLLYFNGNSAITFDLEAIRRANPGSKLLRFRAMAANMGDVLAANMGDDVNCYADIRVLVDGSARFQRRQINSSGGGYSVLVAIGDDDRFLTLATTDGGDGVRNDWIIFGDPRLELLPVETTEQENTKRH
jgi:hypothetical protein